MLSQVHTDLDYRLASHLLQDHIVSIGFVVQLEHSSAIPSVVAGAPLAVFVIRPLVLFVGLRSVSVSVVSASPDDAPLPSFVAEATLFSVASAVVLASCVLPPTVVVSRGFAFASCSKMFEPLSHPVTSFLNRHNNLLPVPEFLSVTIAVDAWHSKNGTETAQNYPKLHSCLTH